MEMTRPNCIIIKAFETWLELGTLLTKYDCGVHPGRTVSTKKSEEESFVITSFTAGTVSKKEQIPKELAALKELQSTSFREKYYDFPETHKNVGTTTMNER